MRYDEELAPISHEEATEVFTRADDTYSVCHSLLRVALHDDDWRWALHQILPFLRDTNPEVRGVAVSCVGYLVRIHRTIDVSAALPMLYALQADAYVARRVRDTLEDIRQFTRAA
jgi:hypothetical protein